MPDAQPSWEPGQSTRFSLAGPAGVLDIWLETPKEYAVPTGIAVICHPHPQYGGSMTNKVVHTLARSALSTGLAAVRFNFRGVGNSQGSFAEGVGETEDAAAVREWLCQQKPDAKLVLAGFSFGAAVALRLAAREEAEQLITIAPPLRYFEGETIPVPQCPWLVVHGDADDVVGCADTLSRLKAAGLQPEHQIIEGAGHFFHGRLHDLRDQVEPWLREHWASLH